MTTRTIELRVKGFGAPPGTAQAEIAELTLADRLKRAGLVFGACIAVAAIALPIPLVHFMLVPGGLLLAFILGGIRLSQSRIFHGVEGRCPLCGTEQEFSVLGRFRLPREVHCETCGRRLVLEGG